MSQASPLSNVRDVPAASQLLGRTLKNDWTVIREFPVTPTGTGGTFSYGYIVRSPTRGDGYLKALDYSEAMKSPQPALALQHMTAAFLHEANLLDVCGDRRMTRIVRAVDRGVTTVPGSAIPVVEYLIFELAEGDIRSYLSLGRQFDLAWVLRTLHQVATGLDQLHRNHIAHQDLKPSNVLTFDAGRSSKIGDLGRASIRGQTALHDDFQVAGDWGYAPPELLYGELASNWNARRQACDLYHLGSLIVFLFSTASMTPLLMAKLAPEHRWREWSGTYTEVLPYVQHAFAAVVEEVQGNFPTEQRADLSRIVRELCDPDPASRGHPRNRIGHSNPYSLQRYVSDLNALARKAEAALKRSL